MPRSWVHHERRDALEREIFRLGEARGRLAVTLDLLTDALVAVGQHRVYCHGARALPAPPGSPAHLAGAPPAPESPAAAQPVPALPRDLLLACEQIQGAKELVQEALEQLTRDRLRQPGA